MMHLILFALLSVVSAINFGFGYDGDDLRRNITCTKAVIVSNQWNTILSPTKTGLKQTKILTPNEVFSLQTIGNLVALGTANGTFVHLNGLLVTLMPEANKTLFQLRTANQGIVGIAAAGTPYHISARDNLVSVIMMPHLLPWEFFKIRCVGFSLI
jgi:hypothetical protein